MCISPVRIRNPNYHYRGAGWQYKDTESAFINIPCRYCSECIAVRQMSLVQRSMMESLKNRMFFATLTYKNDMLPSVTTSSGFDISFADQEHIEMLVRKMRNSGLFPGLRHLAVSEFGGSKGRPHFHVLFLIPKVFLPDYASCLDMQSKMYDFVFNNWSINVGSKKSPHYIPLFEYHQKWLHGKLYKNYDLHYVNPSLSENGCSDVAWYVLKYMLKTSDREKRLQQALRLNLEPEEYELIWNLVRPKLLKCHSFGLNPEYVGRLAVPDWDIVERLRNGILQTPGDSSFPYFFSPDSGLSMPLSRYYAEKGWIYPYTFADRFLKNKDLFIESKSSQECVQKIHKFERILGITEDNGSDGYFTNLF